jgi:DNA-binding SARP family transcriptional activator
MRHLAISLLGPFQVTLNGDPVTHFQADSARALLAYLAMRADRACRRDQLTGLLWPDQPEPVAHQNLRQALSRLRAAIGDKEAACPFLLATRKTIRVNPEAEYWLDTLEFDRLLAACDEHRHRRLHACRSCMRKLREAAELYRGELLAGFSLDSAPFEEWLVVHRERLHRQALEVLHHLAAYYEKRGQVDRILLYAQRQVELEPWYEAAHRQWMRALASGGQRAAALAQYESCRRILAEELDVEPSAETTALYRGIREGGDVGALAQAPSRDLPIPLAPLIGREAELVEIDERLQDPACRLLTLVGPGGIGKTRLALEAAAEQVYDFEHGVFYVSLAEVQSVEDFVSTVAQVLGVAFSGRESPRQQMLRYLRRKEILLVLDNYEHLLPPFAPADPELDPGKRSDGVGLVVDILRATPYVCILVTSRVRLNAPEEQLLHVGGMAYPPPGPLTSGGASAPQYSAVRLFLRSARRVREGYKPVGEDLAHVAHICQMVQGMPLAILLAAAWMEVLSPAEIAAKVEHGLDFLEVDWRGVEQRHRSMLAVFDASWGMLSATERAAFKRLSAFRGGFTSEAAMAVVGASLRTLRGLAHKSFLAWGEAGRYEIHELLRQYAERKLDATPGDRERAFDLHCAYYAHFLAQRRDAFVKRGPGDALAEMGNIRAAWSWALQNGRIPEIRQSIEGIFWLGESTGSRHREKGSTLAPAVDLLRKADPTKENQLALGLALCYYAVSLSMMGLREAAIPLAHEGLSLLRRLGTGRVLALGHILAVLSGVTVDETQHKQLLEHALALAQEADGPLEACWAHNLLAWIGLRHAQYDRAERHWLTFLSIAKEIDHRRGEALSLRGLGIVADFRGQYAQARAFHEQSLSIFQELGERWWTVDRFDALGKIALASGEIEQAGARYQEALALAEELADLEHLARALCGLGEVALATGDVQAARQGYRRALQVALEDPRADTRRHTLVSLAKLYAHDGEPEWAIELLDLVLSTRPDYWSDILRGTESLLSELRSELSPEAYASAQARGRARDLEATLRELLAELEHPDGIGLRDARP